jgi:hypothetical protein
MTTFLIAYSYLPRLRDLMRERGIALCEAGFEMVEMRGLGSEAHAGCDAADARTFATGKMRLPMESLRIELWLAATHLLTAASDCAL